MNLLESGETISSWIWNGIFLPGMVVFGIVFSGQTGFLQITRFGRVLRHTLGSVFCKQNEREGGVSPFRALCMALAGTVGTGSVVGTCQALALGGPGAVFWLWAASFLGMIVKFYEVTLAVCFRRRSQKGEWLGGPMYYLSRGLKRGGKLAAALFAVFGLFSGFGMGNLAQCGSISSETKRIFSELGLLSGKGERVLSYCLAVFLFVALVTSLFGGVKRIGAVTSVLVPLMSLIFMMLSGSVIVFHRRCLGQVLSSILCEAFSSRSVLGGAAGVGAKKAFEWGMKRSVFSNEAGLGSAAIAHASAQAKHPVEQGFFGIFEVFADTVLICTLTAFSVLLGVSSEEIAAHSWPDAFLITKAFSTLFGSRFATLFVGGCLILFAFSTLLGWSFYGEGCARYLFGESGVKPYRIMFCLLAAFGVLLPLRPIWVLSDLFNGLMAIPNLLGLFFLSDTVKFQVKEYFQKEKSQSHAKKI